jgi:DNA-binding MarR family transcriptional regulator
MAYFDKLYLDGELPDRAKLVYFYLRDRMDKNCVAWPGILTIAKHTSLSRSTVKRALADLARAGYIRTEAAYRDNGSHTSNRYHVL